MLRVRGLSKRYRSRDGTDVVALRQVDLNVAPAEAVGVVGPSGCGKTTLLRCLLRLEQPDEGSIQFNGQDWLSARGRALRRLRPRIQAVFQDPFDSLNPLFSVCQLVEEPLVVTHQENPAGRRRRAGELISAVGLDESVLSQRAGELSGGQRQRVAIARALIGGPELLLADEPTSALDAPVRRQILELLDSLRRQRQLAALIVSHDFATVSSFCDRVAVMVAGSIVEVGPTQAVFEAPRHPWTRWLLAALPQPEKPLPQLRPPPGAPQGQWIEVGEQHGILQASSP